MTLPPCALAIQGAAERATRPPHNKERSKTIQLPKYMTPIDMIPALKSIGYDLSDIPDYCIEPGRIVISISDNDDGEAQQTINKLRRRLPAGAKAEWTGNSNTSGDEETTSDCAITWDEA